MGSVHVPGTFCYTKEDGLYQARCGGVVLAEMSHVALAFAVAADGTTFRHQHGTTDSVMHWFKWAKNEYGRLGLVSIADELRVLVSDRWDLDDLNKIVDNGSYIAEFLKKVEADADSRVHFELFGADAPAVPV